ncbi:hypothetical protein GDN83_13535 [Gordonia jinghuaiqii]|nr:hypothetical protein [Gordonia jinghuaiqii]
MFVDAHSASTDRHCDSCGRRFGVRTRVNQAALDHLARVNGWDIDASGTSCPGCRCARQQLTGT